MFWGTGQSNTEDELYPGGDSPKGPSLTGRTEGGPDCVRDPQPLGPPTDCPTEDEGTGGSTSGVSVPVTRGEVSEAGLVVVPEVVLGVGRGLGEVAPRPSLTQEETVVGARVVESPLPPPGPGPGRPTDVPRAPVVQSSLPGSFLDSRTPGWTGEGRSRQVGPVWPCGGLPSTYGRTFGKGGDPPRNSFSFTSGQDQSSRRPCFVASVRRRCCL